MATKMTNRDIVHLVIICSIILAVGFGAFIYFGLPALSEFRNSIYGLLVNFSIISAIILGVTLSRKISMPLLGKVTVWCYGVLFILFCILDLGKIEMFIFFIYAIFNICVTIYLYIKTGVTYNSIWLFGVYSYITTIVVVLRVNYINGELVPSFFLVALIAAIIIFIPCLIYGIKQFELYRDREKLIALPLVALMIAFVVVWLTISSMNVYLDTSAPAYEEYIIIDKYITGGSRQVTTYNLEVKNGDTVFTIGVLETVYYSHEVNDAITLSIYEGAFNEPYYIHESIK